MLRGQKVLTDLAAKAGVTSNNPPVRVNRAQEVQRKRVAQACGICATHGCLDCTASLVLPNADGPLSRAW